MTEKKILIQAFEGEQLQQLFGFGVSSLISFSETGYCAAAGIELNISVVALLWGWECESGGRSASLVQAKTKPCNRQICPKAASQGPNRNSD